LNHLNLHVWHQMNTFGTKLKSLWGNSSFEIYLIALFFKWKFKRKFTYTLHLLWGFIFLKYVNFESPFKFISITMSCQCVFRCVFRWVFDAFFDAFFDEFLMRFSMRFSMRFNKFSMSFTMSFLMTYSINIK
jgi:hypothetical protein